MDGVVARVDLHGSGGSVHAVGELRAESPDIGPPQVQAGTSFDDPLRHRLAHAAGGGDPRRSPRDVEPAHLCRLAQEEVPIGGEDLRADHQFANAHVVERGDADGRAARQRLEVVPVRHHGGRGQTGRDRLRTAADRIPFVPAHQQAADFFAAIDAQVLIAKGGQVARHAERHRHHVLVLDGHNGDGHTNRAADVPGPDPCGADHHRGANRAVRRCHGVHPAVAHVDAGHIRLRLEFASAAARAVCQRVCEPAGVDAAIAGDVGAAHEIAVDDDGTQCLGLAGCEEFYFQAKGLRLGDQPADLFHAQGTAGQAEASHLPPVRIEPCFLPQATIKLDAVHDHPGQIVGAAQLADEPGGAVGGPPGQFSPLHHDDVPPSHEGEMVGDAASGHASADDHCLGVFTHDASDSRRHREHSCPARTARGVGGHRPGGETWLTWIVPRHAPTSLKKHDASPRPRTRRGSRSS